MTGLLRSWTIGQATQAGIVAALVTLLLWPAFALFGEPFRWLFAAALGVLGFCGVSIILITVVDLKFHRGRGKRVRNMRMFDLALALLMLAPGVLVLPDLVG